MMNKDDQVVGISTATSIRPFGGVALLSTTVYGSNIFCTCYTIFRAINRLPASFLGHATPHHESQHASFCSTHNLSL